MRSSYHSYGADVSACNDIREVMSQGGLDWEVLKGKISAQFADGTSQVLEDRMTTYRADTNTVLGVVGNNYEVFQNYETYDWLNVLHGQDEVKWEHAASFQGGRKIAVTCRLPGVSEISEGDTLERFLIAVNSHDGGGSVRLFPSTTRPVCENTLRVVEDRASKNQRILRFIHRESSLNQRVKEGRKFIETIQIMHNKFQQTAQELQKAAFSDEKLNQYFSKILAAKTNSKKAADRHTETLLRIFSSDKNAGGYGSNGWTAFNAVTEWVDHHGRKRSGESRLNSNLFGAADTFKQSALQLAKEVFLAV